MRRRIHVMRRRIHVRSQDSGGVDQEVRHMRRRIHVI
jgi:hypothetical protein